ncbi:spore wall protein 2-like [Quercus suber]|uniref:spore wall protein 2-like n=1 Tax=Quercus suber TaxID=58331 RepID=UPI000CE21432|nr:spore wall protein 2-like [Quercus suber]
MDPEQRRAFGDVADRRFEELVVVQRSNAGVEVDRENQEDREERDGGGYGEASAFNLEELSSGGAAVAGDLVTRGMPDGKELGEEGSGIGDSAVVAAELDGEEDDDAADGANGEDVEKVVDVTVTELSYVANSPIVNADEMDPEQRRAFGDVVDRRFEELVVVQGSDAGVEFDRENQEDREESNGGEYGEASAFDLEELSSGGVVVAGDLATCGVPDGEELGEEGSGIKDSAVVTAELDGEEDDDAADGANGKDVEKVVDVTVTELSYVANGPTEMDPEQRRAFDDVVDRRFEELVVVQRSDAGVEVDRENQEDREERDGGEYGKASAFDLEELSSGGVAVAGDLVTRGMPDGEELGEEGDGIGDSAVVVAELDGEEDDDAADGANGEDVKKEMDPEQRRAFGDVVDRRFEELVVVQRSDAGVEVDRENQEDREESNGGEYGEASAFDLEELSSGGIVVAGDLATRGMLDDEELGEEGSGIGDSAVVAAELDGEEDDDAADGANGEDVEKEMDLEQRRAFGDVVDHRFEELVIVQRSSARVEVDRENQEDREESDGGEYDEASAFDLEELSSVGAAVAGDLATRGVPDGEKLGEEGGGTGDSAVVAAELDGEEDDDATDGANGRDVKKEDREESDGGEYDEASAFDLEELSSVGAAVVGDLATRGVPDGEELGEEGGGTGDLAVVAAELDGEEDDDTADGANGGDVEKVLDVLYQASTSPPPPSPLPSREGIGPRLRPIGSMAEYDDRFFLGFNYYGGFGVYGI